MVFLEWSLSLCNGADTLGCHQFQSYRMPLQKWGALNKALVDCLLAWPLTNGVLLQLGGTGHEFNDLLMVRVLLRVWDGVHEDGTKALTFS